MNRITFLTGYYGSGKTEIAINLAIIKRANVVVDLDVINPYFRSREQVALLKSHQVEVLSNQLKDGMYADLPFIGGEVYRPFLDESITAIYDLGGNDLGAKLLQQFGDYCVNTPVDLFLVVNPFRMETSSVEQVIKLITKIEATGQIEITGLINNTNLLKETTVENLIEGDTFLRQASKETNKAIVYTIIEKSLLPIDYTFAGEVIPFTRYFQTSWN
ncbi:MAG: hypothetical protein U1C51_02400 [Candidatus Izemoplasmatales bacterium]|nr:ATP-binding protein [bacterium]MDZ4196081.1 hypothetical protein [Candidatus Izemoplasmatales bacterium]